MAKNTVFLLTHLASGWEEVVEAINCHPRIQIFNTGTSYSHPDDIRRLRLEPHKQGGAAAVWGDVILHAKDFAMKRLCQHYKLIFWTKRYEEVIPKLITDHGFVEPHATAYYSSMLGLVQFYWGRKYDLGHNPMWNPDLKSDTFLSSILG